MRSPAPEREFLIGNASRIGVQLIKNVTKVRNPALDRNWLAAGWVAISALFLILILFLILFLFLIFFGGWLLARDHGLRTGSPLEGPRRHGASVGLQVDRGWLAAGWVAVLILILFLILILILFQFRVLISVLGLNLILIGVLIPYLISYLISYLHSSWGSNKNTKASRRRAAGS